ncbi:hypothetical protein [Natrialba sp. SSL1]|uniref:hypothetical protein n=1 Tax=Natrialba sp. SSL1 TaxID=1869245 RepID=UPI0008F90CBF|nr:hypothetical protein [Natrialba sp. SSL1]OIB58835.1 hypothetical protein BBD46_06420 [Natrialba sp. SSL1]
MYANDTRDLQGPGRPDESPKNAPRWTTLKATSRDLLIAIACLERTADPITATKLKPRLERWHPDLEYSQLHADLRSLTAANFLTEQPAASSYHLTEDAIQLLKTYAHYLHQLIHDHPATVTITLEQPVTPGDLERAYCKLTGDYR